MTSISKDGSALIDSSQDTIANSHKVLENASTLRKIVFELVESTGFKLLILSVIILNALALGIETDVRIMKYFEWYLNLLNNVFLGIYLFELTIKLYSYRWQYFKSGWNVFDMFVILLSLVSWIVKENVDLSLEMAKLFSIIRIFRSLLIIRFIKELKGVPFLRSLQLIIDTIFASFSTIGSIGLLSGVFLYICTVASVILYGNVYSEKFGTVGTAFVSLFQVLTLDRWYVLLVNFRSEMYTYNTDYKSIWILGFVVIIVQTFVFENLFVAVIINNLKGSRDLVELRKKKQLDKQKKYKLEVKGSKATLGREKSTLEDVEKLFEKQHGIDDYYPPYLSNRLKELLSSYYMNLASLDHAHEAKIRQDKVLDDLIDLAINYQNKEFD